MKNNNKNKKKNNKKKRAPDPPEYLRPSSFVPRAPKGTHAGEGSLASEKVSLPMYINNFIFIFISTRYIYIHCFILLFAYLSIFVCIPITSACQYRTSTTTFLTTIVYRAPRNDLMMEKLTHYLL